MQLTEAELEAASVRQMVVMKGALELLAELPNDPILVPEANIMSTVDGLVGAIAMIAEGSGLVPSQRQKRYFAEQVRVAVMKSMKDARVHMAAELMGAANDTSH